MQLSKQTDITFTAYLDTDDDKNYHQFKILSALQRLLHMYVSPDYFCDCQQE